MYFPKTASTALVAGTFVVLSSGQLVGATSSTTSVLGVLRKNIASTDSDYASTTLVPVEVPIEKYVTWLADFTATFSASQIGTKCDLTDSGHVNTGSNTYNVVTPVGYISATKGLIILNGNYSN
jgi:hypothetical protein